MSRKGVEDMPMMMVVLVFADGTELSRTWTGRDVFGGDKFDQTAALPPFLFGPLKTWPHPQDPITFSARVQNGHESDARAWLEAL